MPLCSITRTWIDKEIHEINTLIKEREAAAAAKQAERLAKQDQDKPEVIAKRFMLYLGIGYDLPPVFKKGLSRVNL